MSLLLSVDPATWITGWALFKTSNGDLVDAGLIRMSHPDADLRLHELNITWGPRWFRDGVFAAVDHLIVEGGFSNGRAADEQLAAARHVLRLPAKLRTSRPVNILKSVQPSSWKLAVIGRGNASKDDVLAYVRARWPVETDSEDVADSIAIGMYGLKQVRIKGASR